MSTRRTSTVVHLTRGWENQGRAPSTAPLRIAQPVASPFRDDRYYTVIELVDHFQVSRDTIYTWVSRGLLVPQRLPKRLLFLGRDINRFLAEQQAS